MGPKSLQHYKEEYDEALASGFFQEYFPQLTGNWALDHIEFVKMQKLSKAKVHEKQVKGRKKR